jgi:hypothetical protein
MKGNCNWSMIVVGRFPKNHSGQPRHLPKRRSGA